MQLTSTYEIMQDRRGRRRQLNRPRRPKQPSRHSRPRQLNMLAKAKVTRIGWMLMLEVRKPQGPSFDFIMNHDFGISLATDFVKLQLYQSAARKSQVGCGLWRSFCTSGTHWSASPCALAISSSMLKERSNGFHKGPCIASVVRFAYIGTRMLDIPDSPGAPDQRWKWKAL